MPITLIKIRIEQKIIDLLNDQNASKVLATVNSNGIPNVVPKRINFSNR